MSFSGSEVVFVPGFIHTWNKDGVHFNVNTVERSRDEARRVVESMISQ